MDNVRALAVCDFGYGPALYVGGSFTFVGPVYANHLAFWDGTHWSALPATPFGIPAVITAFGDGAGQTLYVGAWESVFRWASDHWDSLGFLGGNVRALAVFDDGTGAALFGGSDIGEVGRWDGTQWISLGRLWHSDFFPEVDALGVFDDGHGPALFAGGHFDTLPGGAAALNIARWDGRSWAPVGEGLWGDSVQALCVFDEGRGPALFAGGYFGGSGNLWLYNVGRWDGQAWSALQHGPMGRCTR